MALLTLKAPAAEPVSVAQLIGYGHIDPNEDQALLGMLISSAREWCEAFCERAFMYQTKRLLMDFFPGYVDMKLAGQKVSSPFVSGANAVLVGIRYAIILPWPFVRRIVTLQYQDPNDGSMQTMTPVTPSTASPSITNQFIVDIDSQPARLTPTFGNMWPVARVAVNAVQVDYQTGYAGPIAVSMTAGSAALTSDMTFLSRDIGQPISIPNAAAGGKTPLAATIVAVDASGNATLDQAAGASVSGQTTNFGAVPNSVQLAILALAAQWYEQRIPDKDDVPEGVKASLYPFRDLRF
jgi:hypothetical protein